MTILRSERLAALLLISAAAIGLIAANTPAGPALFDLVDRFIASGDGTFNLSVRHWVPAAAVGGVIVPRVVYLVVTRGSSLSDGWPIPTATDIASALGVLALVGRGLPASGPFSSPSQSSMA